MQFVPECIYHHWHEKSFTPANEAVGTERERLLSQAYLAMEADLSLLGATGG